MALVVPPQQARVLPRDGRDGSSIVIELLIMRLLVHRHSIVLQINRNYIHNCYYVIIAGNLSDRNFKFCFAEIIL